MPEQTGRRNTHTTRLRFRQAILVFGAERTKMMQARLGTRRAACPVYVRACVIPSKWWRKMSLRFPIGAPISVSKRLVGLTVGRQGPTRTEMICLGVLHRLMFRMIGRCQPCRYL